MRNAHGVITIATPDQPLVEIDTFQCAHCGTVVPVYVGGTYGGCYKCGCKPICLPCESKGTCTPFEKWLEQVEGRK